MGEFDGLTSIVIRTQGRRLELLAAAIDSVRAQSAAAVETVVVFDGGPVPPDFRARLGPSDDPLLRLESVEANGRSAAGNVGLNIARGEYLGFLDDDDLLLPGHIEALRNALESRPEVGAAYAAATEVLTKGLEREGLPLRDGKGRKYFVTPYSRARLWVSNIFPVQSVLFRRRLFETCGGFDPDLEYLEDWDLWLRFSQVTEFLPVDVVTSVFRVPAEKDAQRKRAALHAAGLDAVRRKHANTTATFPFAEIAALEESFVRDLRKFAGIRYCLRMLLDRLLGR